MGVWFPPPSQPATGACTSAEWAGDEGGAGSLIRRVVSRQTDGQELYVDLRKIRTLDDLVAGLAHTITRLVEKPAPPALGSMEEIVAFLAQRTKETWLLLGELPK